MGLLVLMSLVSLASARCNNIVSSICGQNSALIPGSHINGPYAIFNSASNGFGNSYVTGTLGGFQQSDCLHVDVLPLSLREVYFRQPLFTRVVENTAQYRARDNACTTFYPVPDDDKSFIAYLSTVYSDGSNIVESFIFTEVAPGVFGISNAEYTITERFFATVGNSLYMSCTRTEFGDSDFPERIVLSFDILNPLGLSCVNQIQQMFNCNGLSQPQGLYVMPYRLPTRCYTQQTCFSTNPFSH